MPIPRGYVALQLPGLPARLALLACDVNLQQDIHRAVQTGGLAVDAGQQPFAVHRLDAGDVGHQHAHLVGLQMADHVPFDVARQSLGFRLELLRPALAEDPLPGGVGLGDPVGRMGFRDGDERDAGGQLPAYFVES